MIRNCFTELFINWASILSDWTSSFNISSTMTEYILELDDEASLPTCQTTDFIETVISISNVLTVVNSAANFLIYMLRGKKFRDLFLQTYFSKCIQRSQDPSYRANGKSISNQSCHVMLILTEYNEENLKRLCYHRILIMLQIHYQQVN